MSKRNIYHGDLAARNILLNEELVAKVSDFGLSKRLYHDFSKRSVYEENNDALRLPMKWLALEVLKHGQIVPSKSDVWSFGSVAFRWCRRRHRRQRRRRARTIVTATRDLA